MKHHLSYPKDKIRILLLEGIHVAAEDNFHAADYSCIENQKGSYSEEQLLRSVGDVHVLGIRSKTEISARVIEAAPHLLSIGCFCIGTDQVDLEAATRKGVAVFREAAGV